MSRLVLRILLAAPALLLALVLFVPADLSAHKRAPTLPKGISADLALVPGDCAVFFTFRQRDFLGDSLMSGLFGLVRVPSVNQRLTRIPPEQVERLTLVLLRSEEVAIVRTSKPYDSAKVRDQLRPRFHRRPIRKGDPDPRTDGKIREKKVGDRTISFKGEDDRHQDAVCLVDRHVFVAGTIGALEHVLSGKAQVSEELSEALTKASKHAFVSCVQGKALRALLEGLEQRRYGRDDEMEAVPEAPAKTEKGKCGAEEEAAEGQKKQKDAGSEKKARDVYITPQLLPYKPLIMGRTAVLTADIRPKMQANVKITFDKSADLDQAETSLKTLLYVGGETVGYLGFDARLISLSSALDSVKKDFRLAKVVRKGTTLQASVTLDLNAKDRKVLGETMAQVARQNRVRNNLLQLGVAMHNYLSSYNHFPPAAITDAAGKALLSWRVAILPYIEESDLYKEFKLDEPWDSAHNKKLLPRMPKFFAPVGVKTKEANTTFLQVCTGPNTPWPTLSTKPGVATFTDGFSNTLLIVEASEAVPWTKPVDVALVANKPLPAFGAQFKDVFLTVMADGSLRTLPRKLDAKLLRLLIDPNDGQVIPWNKIEGKR